MIKINNKGFTLIELLIVIAIIAVLASVVIVSIGDQGGKADLAVAKAEAAQTRTLATLALNEAPPQAICEDVVSGADTNMKKVIKALGEDATCISGTTSTSKNKWVVVFKAEGGYYCIGDDSGVVELKGNGNLGSTPNVARGNIVINSSSTQAQDNINVNTCTAETTRSNLSVFIEQN